MLFEKSIVYAYLFHNSVWNCKYFVYGSKSYHLSFIKAINHCFTHVDVKYNKYIIHFKSGFLCFLNAHFHLKPCTEHIQQICILLFFNTYTLFKLFLFSQLNIHQKLLNCSTSYLHMFFMRAILGQILYHHNCH